MTYPYITASGVQLAKYAFLKAVQSLCNIEKSAVKPDNFWVIETRPLFIPEINATQRYQALRTSETRYSVFREDKRHSNSAEPDAGFLSLHEAITYLKEREEALSRAHDKASAVPYNHYSRVEALLTDWPERQYFAANAQGDKDHSRARERYHRKFCPYLFQ